MKNSEIRSLVEEAKADIAYCEEHINLLPMYDFKMTIRLTSAIETLLAREAEVLEWAKGKHGIITASDEENGYFIAVKADGVYEQVRAILKPEENSNG